MLTSIFKVDALRDDENSEDVPEREFTDIDLSENEWVEYDEDTGLSCAVLDLEFRFVKVR